MKSIFSAVSLFALTLIASGASAGQIVSNGGAWVNPFYSFNPPLDCFNLAAQDAAIRARNICVYNFGFPPALCATAPVGQVFNLGGYWQNGLWVCGAQAVLLVP